MHTEKENHHFHLPPGKHDRKQQHQEKKKVTTTFTSRQCDTERVGMMKKRKKKKTKRPSCGWKKNNKWRQQEKQENRLILHDTLTRPTWSRKNSFSQLEGLRPSPIQWVFEGVRDAMVEPQGLSIDRSGTTSRSLRDIDSST